MNNHYVYCWSDPEYGIFYVGQGKHNNKRRYDRAFNYHDKQSYLQKFLSTIASDEIDVIIISDNISKDAADVKEKYIINFLGRIIDKNGKLANFTTGGSDSNNRPGKEIVVNGKKFKTIQECAEYYGVSHGKICHCLREGKVVSSNDRRNKKILYNNINFESISELAKYYNITTGLAYNRLKNNIPLDLPVDKHLIEYEGATYTKKELAEKYGLTIENLDRRLKKNIPLEQKIIKKQKLKIDGIIYDSLSDAQRLTGLTAKYIYYWYKRGKFDP